MSLTLQALMASRCPSPLYLSLSRSRFLKSPNIAFLALHSRNQSPNDRFFSSRDSILRLSKINPSFEESLGTFQERSGDSVYSSSGLNFDVFLSILEFLSLASAAAISIYVAMSCGVQNKEVLKFAGNKIFVWQCMALATGVVVGAVIRRRQWGLVSVARYSQKSASAPIISAERVEKLEEDLRSLAVIVRVLSRQLEKLGIRFRITRKALKESLLQTAALVQKNSEATRALAAQEDILETELGEIQKVLLAMQEQQQKQLELIIAISKAGKIWEIHRTNVQRENDSYKASEALEDGVSHSEINQVEASMLQKESN